MTEHDKAKAWMARNNISVDQLAAMTGYGKRSVYWMLRGQSPPNATRAKPALIADWVWQRFEMACAGVDAQLKTGRTFKW